jgi:hypothetical protein
MRGACDAGHMGQHGFCTAGGRQSKGLKPLTQTVEMFVDHVGAAQLDGHEMGRATSKGRPAHVCRDWTRRTYLALPWSWGTATFVVQVPLLPCWSVPSSTNVYVRPGPVSDRSARS